VEHSDQPDGTAILFKFALSRSRLLTGVAQWGRL
jgi:hypothetical protein